RHRRSAWCRTDRVIATSRFQCNSEDQRKAENECFGENEKCTAKGMRNRLQEALDEVRREWRWEQQARQFLCSRSRSFISPFFEWITVVGRKCFDRAHRPKLLREPIRFPNRPRRKRNTKWRCLTSALRPPLEPSNHQDRFPTSSRSRFPVVCWRLRFSFQLDPKPV